MKKVSKGWIAVIAVVVILGGYVMSTYNSLVGLDEGAKQAWSDLQADYKRRADLIPNLVNVVKGYASHERETLESLVAARAKATQIKVDIDDPEKIKEFEAAQGEVGAALSRLIAVTESYPDLKANDNFKELQSQLEGTENRIKVSRENVNKAFNRYNVAVRRFPDKIVASMFGFEIREMYEAEPAAQEAPTVTF